MGALKAFVGAAIAFVATFLDEWTGDGDPLSPRDYIFALLAGLVAFNGIYFTTNRP